MVMEMSVLMLLFVASGVDYVIGYQIKSAPLLKERPEWLKECRVDDPELNDCFKEVFVKIFPQLAVGIPEINVDPFEPLPLDKVSVSKGAGPVTLAGSLFDISVVGPSNSTPTFALIDLEKKKVNFGIYIPKLDITSQYNLRGNILLLPLVGNGDCVLKLRGVDTNISTNITFVEKEGRRVINFDKMHVSFKVKGMRVHFDNLFNGNKVLGLTMNNFLNQNAIEVIGELEDNIGSSLAGIFLQLINNIFSKIPLDLWLKDGGGKVETDESI